MSAKHTPGPWEFCGNDSLPILHVYAPDHRNVFNGERPLEEQEANARLTAAAPDLLEAAKRAEKVIDILWVSHHSSRADPALEELRAAIRKATGEQQ